MTWWWRVCRAAFTRWDEWRQWRKEQREKAREYAAFAKAWREKYQLEDADWFADLLTPEDHAGGPFDPVTRIPGPRHARRADPGEGT